MNKINAHLELIKFAQDEMQKLMGIPYSMLGMEVYSPPGPFLMITPPDLLPKYRPTHKAWKAVNRIKAIAKNKFKKLEVYDAEWYYKMGIYYGYPACCIENFIGRCKNLDGAVTKEQDAVHKYHGFIPCPSCSQKILDGKETLHSLIKNRECKTPFPLA